MQKAKETINKSIWSSIFDCQGLLQLEVVELWDLHYSCVHCSPSIVGGLDNALRLDQLSIIDGGNKLTVYHQTSSWACVSVSKFIKLVVGGRFVVASCQLPETRDPRARRGYFAQRFRAKGSREVSHHFGSFAGLHNSINMKVIVTAIRSTRDYPIHPIHPFNRQSLPGSVAALSGTVFPFLLWHLSVNANTLYGI